MLELSVAAGLFVVFVLIIDRFMCTHESPRWLNWKLYLPTLLLLNFLDWWLTKQVLAMEGVSESSPLLRYIMQNSPYIGDVFKLIWASLAMIVAAFCPTVNNSLRAVPLALMLLLSLVLIFTSINLLLL